MYYNSLNVCNCTTFGWMLPDEKVELPCVAGSGNALPPPYCEKELNKFYNLKSWKVICDDSCPVPCLKLEYPEIMSFSYWPTKDSIFSFLTQFLLSRSDYKELIAYKKLTTLGFELNITNDRLLAKLNRLPKNREPRNAYKQVRSWFLALNKTVKEDIATWVSESFLRVNIYYSSMEEKIMEQSPAFETWDLFSDLGGLLGLCLGVSVITAVELLGLVTGIISVICKKFIIKSDNSVQVFNDNQ